MVWEKLLNYELCPQTKHKNTVVTYYKICLIFILADGQRAGLGAGPIQGVGGGQRAHEEGGPTPGIKAAALDLGKYCIWY